MKNILVLYYSQTGQIKEILNSMLKPFDDNEFKIDFVEIKPKKIYNFPWSSEAFFDVFPYSKAGISCELETININNTKKYDLIILGLQVWYLEPSIPIASFLKSKYADILKDKPIITVYGTRNMWINAHKTLKALILKKQAKYIGNIVLADRHNNLVSVLTIVRWLLKGQKQASKYLPTAGVSDKDIKDAKRFALPIKNALNENNFKYLQKELLKEGAVKVDYHIMKTEFAGSKIFNVWSSLILKKSTKGSPKRKRLLVYFKYYLYFVIFIVSPISSIIFKLIRLFFHTKTENEILKQTSLS